MDRRGYTDLIDFVRHPDCALDTQSFGCGGYKSVYLYNYEAIFEAIAAGKIPAIPTYRKLLLEDLFFLVCFGMGIEKANHPFVVDRCKDVQFGPVSDTLDVWARFHWKSTIITQGETIQYHLKNPEHCSAILAYNRPAAKKPLRSIKRLFEEGDFLKQCFTDVLWDRPESHAPKWSEDDGLVLKRTSMARRESTIEAWGLTEGMPIGSHYERGIYDDLETDDIRESPDMLDKVFNRFEMALINLGTGSDSDRRRIIGTYYSHFGPNVRIRDKVYPDGRKMFFLRLIPGSSDGTRDGEPVLMDANSWEMAKTLGTFNSQQLCDPTPSSEIKLDKHLLKPIERQFIPRDVYKFMVLDQAGGDETNKQSTDLWSFGVIGVQPVLDDVGQSNIYLMDIQADTMSHSEGINGVVTMYLRNGIIEQMGVEKVGLSTTEMHISNALKVRGRKLSLDAGNLVLLKPSGRSKVKRVENALQWPLNNGKIYYSTEIPERYIDAIREEMDKFPYFHVDILDMIAYVYDMIKEYRFPYRDDVTLPEKYAVAADWSPFEN